MAAKNTNESNHVTFIEEKNPENIQVCVRMRPLLEPYEDELAWEVDNDNNVIKTRSDLKSVVDSNKIKALTASGSRYYNELLHQQIFTFDNVLGPEIKTRDIYNRLCKRLVVSVLQGYNGTIFMYGQTTSGKTYSMLGTTKDPGILPYSMRTIFQEINRPEGDQYGISISYLEIYNETINDLLVPGSTGLKIIDDPKYGVIVKGLKRQKVKTFEEAIYLMNFGEEHRMYRETNFHEHSSRSHTIYQVNLVDLAGSERLGDSEHNDAQAEETGHINKSLFLLTNLIKKLAEEKAQHIPYRDSKLTRILSNALGGNSLTTIVCTVSPALMNYNQTLSTLRFASRAKKITNKPTINEIDDAEAHHQLKQEIKYLLERLHQSENEILKVNTINNKLEDSLQLTKQEIVNLQKDFEELKAIFIKESFKQQTEENMSSSGLDLSDTGANSKSKLKKGVSSEFFFGDPMINYIEQAFNESQILSPSSDATPNEMNNFKEWSIQSLKSKYGYLKELKLVQQKYAESLLGETFRYLNKNKHHTVQQFAKVYLQNELGKNDIISARIWEALKRYDSDSEVFTPELKDEKAYGQIIQRIEKKYDEVAKASNQTPNKKSNTNNPTTPDAKNHAESTETNNSKPLQKQSYYSEDFMQKSPDSPKIELIKTDKEKVNKFESPSGSGIPTPKLDSLIKMRSTNPFNIQKPNSGTAYLFGIGKDGRLGTGSNNDEVQPVPIENMKFSHIACGYHNTFAISQDKSVYAWGKNEIGELGVGDFRSSSIPVNISLLNQQRVESLACGFQHVLALTNQGKVLSWGCGDDGQLGHGDNYSKNIPSEIKFFEKMKVQSISCGHSQSGAYTSDNCLYTWGNNQDYRIMNSNAKNHTIPALTELHKLRLTAENQSNFDVVSFSIGTDHMCVVTKEGKVYSAGRGNEGQLGREMLKSQDKITAFRLSPQKNEQEEFMSYPLCEVDLFGKLIKATMVACGEKYSLVLSNKNKVYAFGDGTNGCLGIDTGKITSIKSPAEITTLSDFKIIGIAAGPKHAACISYDGDLYCWGANYYYEIGQGNDQKVFYLPKKVNRPDDSKVVSVSCGQMHTAILFN